MDAAVGIDDIMIADVVPAKALMVASDALHGAVGIGTGGGAMDDDFGDCSHGVFARFNLIQWCSRPLPAVGQNGFSGSNGRLWAATVSQHTQQ